MPLVSAAVPAPWWTPLTYRSESVLGEGLRVRVPLGRDSRVALTVAESEEGAETEKIKSIERVIDEKPPLPAELWRLIKWFGDTWFIGTGLAAKTLLPAKFFTDEKLPEIRQTPNSYQKFSVESLYGAELSKRYEYYRTAAEGGDRALILFPEAKLAKAFWKTLPKGLQDCGALWPLSPQARWKMWRLARSGELRFIVGSPAAAFAPLAGLSAIVMDEENSGSWRTQSHPLFNTRSLLGVRADFAGSRLVLGGIMPSSKCYLRAKPICLEDKNDERLVFVSSNDSQSAEFEALRDTLPLSVPLIRESVKAREEGGWVFWLLDRKGYASEILCEECGSTLRCARCGSSMRWEDSKKCLSCSVCGGSIAVPQSCPNCGGRLLIGSRPGLEALYERARSALKYKFKNVLLMQNKEEKLPDSKQLKREFPDGALIVGTRRLLSLCDELSPAAVGWIDADAEARGAEYDSKARAFAMLWESMWRGAEGCERKVIVQSRRPSTGWQEGLRRGWGLFWRRELKERSEWELPPFMPLIKISAERGDARKISQKLDEAGAEYWASEEDAGEIWVRTKRFAALREILKPFFSIASTKKTFPTVSLYLD